MPKTYSAGTRDREAHTVRIVRLPTGTCANVQGHINYDVVVFRRASCAVTRFSAQEPKSAFHISPISWSLDAVQHGARAPEVVKLSPGFFSKPHQETYPASRGTIQPYST
jgi:hypothetical protein